MNPDLLLTHTLCSHPSGRSITRVMAAALAAVDPYTAVARQLRRDGGQIEAAGRTHVLAPGARVWVVGAGKAAYPMAQAARDALGDLIAGGLVITKDGHAPDDTQLGPIQLCYAAHPVPDERGAAATKEIKALLGQTRPGDLALCLLSGGASALLTAPADGLGLTDLRTLTAALLACGASIDEINTLRKHVDEVKGGGLARWAAPASVEALILSDVIGDPVGVIASGPCAADPSTYVDAWNIVARYGLESQLPGRLVDHLQAGLRGEEAESAKPGDLLFEKSHNTIVAGNRQAARAALEQARQEGWQTKLLTTTLQGEAREVGRELAALARQPHLRPICLVAGGETTVTLHGDGLGGRNQELALAAVEELAGLPGSVFVALATDGGDGPTDAAGAVVSGETLTRAQALGLDPRDFLARNDAYHFFQPLGDLLMPGPTRTNVCDLVFLFLGK